VRGRADNKVDAAKLVIATAGARQMELLMQKPTSQAASPSRNSGSRRRVSGTDLNLFNAIVGEHPILPPAAAERAAAQRLEDATLAQAQKQQRPRPRYKIAIPPAAPAMIKQIRAACHRGISLRVKRPDVAHWLRSVSDQVLHRLEEAQARLTAARQKVTPPAISPEPRPQTVRFNGDADGQHDSYPLPQYSERPSPAMNSRSKVA
jgi:hypothetical protein